MIHLRHHRFGVVLCGKRQVIAASASITLKEGSGCWTGGGLFFCFFRSAKE
jgi:hypothetical protein